jgi:hypothetical protein
MLCVESHFIRQGWVQFVRFEERESRLVESMELGDVTVNGKGYEPSDVERLLAQGCDDDACHIIFLL